MSFSILILLLGIAHTLLHVEGVLKPAKYGKRLHAFPRSNPIGYFLMLLGTGWFLYNLQQEKIADFMAYKKFMLIGFAAVGIGCCLYVRDFLAVRGLSIVLLLLAKLVLDKARYIDPYTEWRLVIVVWAYLWIVIGIWWTVSPWRCRDLINKLRASEGRIKNYCLANTVFGVAVAVLGLTAFRGVS